MRLFLIFSTGPFAAQVPNLDQAGVETLTFYVDDTVITDGIESCDGDPVTAAAMLKKPASKCDCMSSATM